MEDAFLACPPCLKAWTMPEMQNVLNELRKADFGVSAKVIIGGALITDEFGQSIGADAAWKEDIKGVEICKRWVSRGLNSFLP